MRDLNKRRNGEKKRKKTETKERNTSSSQCQDFTLVYISPPAKRHEEEVAAPEHSKYGHCNINSPKMCVFLVLFTNAFFFPTAVIYPRRPSIDKR